MVSNLDLSTLVSQIPEAQRIQSAQIVHPEALQALAGELALRRQRREGKRVGRARASDTENQVRDGENPDLQAGTRRFGREAEDNPEQDQGGLIDTIV